MPARQLVVETVFREEYGKVIALLLSRFGPSHLEDVVDAVQDALISAMQVWGYTRIPDHPTSWLLKVAQNRLIDKLRRDRKMQFVGSLPEKQDAKGVNDVELREVVTDSQLKMIFACCHPALPSKYQLVLSLKLIAGFGNREIANALLNKEESIAKTFTRARKKLKNTVHTLEIPVEMGLQSRLTNVLRVIYLLFSEGYSASYGELGIKRDFCREAIRLAKLLVANTYCNQPNVHALLALMCFHTARFDARIDGSGELVDLERQDRQLYSHSLIQLGVEHLEQASKSVRLPSSYHLEAAVSYYHCIAPEFDQTRWDQILHLYDLQLQRAYSPVVALNRIVPYFKIHGATAALEELALLESSPHFNPNALYHAIRAELLGASGEFRKAARELKKAIDLNSNLLEKRHLLKKREQMLSRIM